MENFYKQNSIIIKFANIVFILVIIISHTLIFYAIYKIFYPPENITITFYKIVILFSFSTIALLIIGLLKFSNHLKVNLSLLFCSIGITLYILEVSLFIFSQKKLIAWYSEIDYDTRSKIEVLDDLIQIGKEAYPNIVPSKFRNLNGLDSIYPLGTISNSTTILDNEAGYYPIIETDEHGFNNPKGLYIPNNVDIILTGDSFTEGYSVHPDETISAVLRKLKFNTISIGKGGNGPLLELAALKEYAEPVKPRIILWLYFYNDFENLAGEIESSILKQYLDENNYSQTLILRQKEIDHVLRNYAQTEWERQKNLENENWNSKIHKILILTEIRSIVYSIYDKSNQSEYSSIKPVFKDILKKSKQIVSKWDGKIYFVYLPSFERYAKNKKDLFREYVMRTVEELDIAIIDIEKEIFDIHSDPLSLFPFKIEGHYNADGYELIANKIAKRLKEDNYIPIKLNNE